MLGGHSDDQEPNNGSVHRAYIEEQLFILDQLPGVSSIQGPTFTLVHLLIPHVPYVFDANGDIWSDPGFYSGERDEPIDEWHWKVGYTSEVQFINNRMLGIISSILENSEMAIMGLETTIDCSYSMHIMYQTRQLPNSTPISRRLTPSALFLIVTSVQASVFSPMKAIP
jgi:hypothetical protein